MNNLEDVELIIGNSGKNFSGVTSITIQLLSYQYKEINLAVLGSSFIPDEFTTINFYQFIKLTQNKLSNGKYRIFFTRRNDEMIQGLVAKYVFGSKIKIIFLSTAQRNHTRFTKWLISKMDSVISTSKKAASYLVKEPDVIIPHGVDLKRFSSPINKEDSWDMLNFPGSLGIGIFGRVRYSKGIDILIDAAINILPNYPSATIIVCGETQIEDQPYKKKIVSKIKTANLEDRIIFLGKKTFEELPNLFQGMTIVAALSRNEGYGLTPFEGMASGAAVLTSSEGVWDEIIRDGVHGYVVDTNDIKQTSDKLDLLIKNSSKTKIMGENAAEYIKQNLSIETEAKKLIAHIRHVQNTEVV